MLVDLDNSPLIDMTDDEKIGFVAARILKKYKPASVWQTYRFVCYWWPQRQPDCVQHIQSCCEGQSRRTSSVPQWLCRIRDNSDRGSQYTSPLYREAIQKYDIQQSMNSAGGRCHDNARCESMWARMKTELLYDRYDTEKMTTDELKTIIWRYFTSYWNNRRICSTNRGLPPMIKRQQYYASLKEAA